MIIELLISLMMFEYCFKGVGEFNGYNLGNLMFIVLDNFLVCLLDVINFICNMFKVDVNILLMFEYLFDLVVFVMDGKWVTGEISVDEMI